MAILTADFIEKPYSDKKLSWLLDDHRYRLSIDHANKQTGLDLIDLWNGEENLTWYLEYVARVAYTYILKFKDPKYRKKMLYYLSHSKDMRDALIEIMVDMITYNFEDGGFLIAYQTGINLKEMTDMEMKIEKAMSVVGDKILENYSLKQRYFQFDFDIDDNYRIEW